MRRPTRTRPGLRRLAAQIRARKVVVKLFLGHPLHAKLYLLFRPDPINPIVGYLGSSNLTQSGLSRQGELNVDVLDHDACRKLAGWFEERWTDRWCVDISDELAEIIDTSWARDTPIPPHHIYVKMAYHLSQEARAGLTEFRIPRDFGTTLLDFQAAAVKIAAHHLNRRGGVLIGDVVGLGKTLMATALACVFEDDQDLETLILCPKNLVSMWEDYRDRYRLRARVLSVSRVTSELPRLRRYRLVVIDESHNLRNREGKRYRAIQEYVRENDSKCILLSATPYNKTYEDLSSQLRLFVPEDEDLGIRPERLLRDLGETEFVRRHQAPVRSLAAFEQSEYAEDWRELMRRYLVRRTRSFIRDNYAATDAASGRKSLTFEDGSTSYFPTRVPRTLRFDVDGQYARLFADDVVNAVKGLQLPRYGLGNYVAPSPHAPPSPAEAKVLDDLSRAGKRLMGFCRTNLFKRLESSGHAFLLSVERHVLRNFVFLHAIEYNLPLPIGTTDVGVLDTQSFDGDAEAAAGNVFEAEDGDTDEEAAVDGAPRTEAEFRARAAALYTLYAGRFESRFRWLAPRHFEATLRTDLAGDAETLRSLLVRFGTWHAADDTKLRALADLLTNAHGDRKVLVFTQFADTVRYLAHELAARGVAPMAAVTGAVSDPTALARRFSPKSNGTMSRAPDGDELRVLVATDVLSEGQNLQDCAIVVNYDLPWAIIRLIQRAGRVDRLGQQAPEILCYSFLPADGIDRLIRLRERVRTRLRENAEVVGTDEAFFEDEDQRAIVRSVQRARRHPRRRGRDGRRPVVLRLSNLEERHRGRSLARTTDRSVAARRIFRTRVRADAGAARGCPGLSADRAGQRRAGVDRPRRQQRDREPVRDSARRGVRTRYARADAARRPPRPGAPRRGTHRPRGTAGRRPTRTAFRRPLPHVRTAQGIRRTGGRHAVRHRGAPPRHRRPLSPPAAAGRG